MELRYSFSCDLCIAKFIGPALERKLRTVDKTERDKCYGCGDANVEVWEFSHWYPWPDNDAVEDLPRGPQSSGDPSVRQYRLVLRDEPRLDKFDLEVVLRSMLLRFGIDVISLTPTDGRPSYADIQARELTLTDEDEEAIARLLAQGES